MANLKPKTDLDWFAFDPADFYNHPDFFHGYKKTFLVRATGSDDVSINLDSVWNFLTDGYGKKIKPQFRILGITFEVAQYTKWKGRPERRKPDESTYEEVTISEFDSKGEHLLGFTKQDRAVYSNSKGRYIKTRSDGRVPLTFDNPPRVHYRGGKPVKPNS